MRRCKNTRRRRFGAEDRGATAVEFAIVSPLIIAIMLGAFEFGLAVYEKVKLNAGAAAAARAFAMYGDEEAKIKAAITAEIGTKMARNMQLAMSDATISGGDFKKLDVAYTHQFIVGIAHLTDEMSFTATRYAPIVSTAGTTSTSTTTTTTTTPPTTTTPTEEPPPTTEPTSPGKGKKK